MQRWGGDVFGEIEAYAELGSGSDGKGHRVAEDRRTRGDRDRLATSERDRVNRARPDARRVDGRRNRHRANEEGRGAVFVRKANADLGSSDGDPHALSHSLVFDLE